MMRPFRLFILCLLFPAMADPSHASGFLRDLKLDSVRVAGQQEVNEYERIQPIDRQDRVYLIVTLASKIDLVEYRKKVINLYADVYFCNYKKKKILIGGFNVFVNKYPLYMHARNPKKDGSGNYAPDYVQAADFRDRLYHYELILSSEFLRDAELPNSFKTRDQQFYLKYDLVESPLDICMQVRSANWRIRKSKTIVIPKEQIRDLFEAEGMR